MANQKITDLAALTSAVGTDVIEIVSDPGGTPVSKKITVDNLISKSDAMAVQTNPKAMAQVGQREEPLMQSHEYDLMGFADLLSRIHIQKGLFKSVYRGQEFLNFKRTII